MDEREKEFMRGLRKKRRPPDRDDPKEKAREWGRQGMKARWGDHGPTLCVRAFSPVVERFRAFVPQERDRAGAASDALTAYMDAQGAPRTPQAQEEPPSPAPQRSAPPGPPVTINAVLTYHWYGEIEAGRKRVEYRDISDYWTERLWANGMSRRIKAIRFSRGYTNTRMTWEVVRIARNEGEGVYEIHLGKRLS